MRSLFFTLGLLCLTTPVAMAATPSPTGGPSVVSAQILSQKADDPLKLSLCLALPQDHIHDLHMLSTPPTLTHIAVNDSSEHMSCYTLSFEEALKTHVSMLSIAYTLTDTHAVNKVDLVLDMLTHTVSVVPNNEVQENTMNPDKTTQSAPIPTMNARDQAEEPLFEAALLEQERSLPHEMPKQATVKTPSAWHLDRHKKDNPTITALLMEQNHLLKEMNHRLDLLLKK